MRRFTDAYFEYMKEFTDCPDVFIQWGAMLAISASLSRSVCVEIGAWNISPHIWVVFIGKSSSHKSTAIERAEDLMQATAPNRMAPAEFSQEAIIQSLSECSNRFFVFDEAKSFFDSMSKKYNEGMKSLFTTLYRKPHYTRTTLKHGTLNISNAYLTMGMASTPEWLRASLQDAEQSAMSGFLARFLMVPYMGTGNTPLALPPPHSLSKFADLQMMLNDIQLIHKPFKYEQDALPIFESWYHETTERENAALPVLGPFFEHFKNEAIHKLGVILAVDRGETSITADALKEAILALAYIEDMLPGLIEDMTGTKWDREHAKLRDIIRSKGVIDRSDLSRASHLSGQHLTAHLLGFSQDRNITQRDEHTATKTKQIITWVGE